MSAIPMMAVLGLFLAISAPENTGAMPRSVPRAGIWAADGPEYAERPRLSVREKQPARTLRIGDAAPALQVDEWTANGPAAPFKPGVVSAIVFVPASYSGMDKLLESISKLADRFIERPVQVIAVAGEEERMKLPAWRVKVEAMRAKIRFPLAWDKGVLSRSAYLTATGEQQPTMVYVVDGNGRLAWYGLPGNTTAILNAVIGGTWDLDRVRNEIESDEDLGWIRVEIIRSQRAKDIERFLKAGDRLTTEFADPPSLEFSEALRDDLMQLVHDTLAPDSAFNPKKDARTRGLILAAAVRASRIDHDNKPRSLALLGRARFLNGDRAGALKSARRALELAGQMQPPDRELIDQLAEDVAEYGIP